MSGIDEYISTTSFPIESTCMIDHRYFRLVEIILSSIFLPVHIFVIIAMVLHRDIVARNVVNLYAGNVIVSNIVSDIWRIHVHAVIYANTQNVTFHTMEHIHHLNEVQHESHGETVLSIQWWNFRKAFSVVLLLIISGSIGLVTNALRVSMFRVHRTVAGFSRRLSSFEQRQTHIKSTVKKRSLLSRIRYAERKNPKAVAVISMFFVWFVPIVLTLPTIVLNHCKNLCHCLYDHIPSDHSINCPPGCSNFIPPISRMTILVAFGLWLAYLVSLTIFLGIAYRDLNNLVALRAQEIRKLESKDDLENNRENSVKNPNLKLNTNDRTEVIAQATNGDETLHDKNNGNNNSQEINPEIPQSSNRKESEETPLGSLLLESVRKSLLLLFSMYFAYIIGSTPYIGFAVADVLQEKSIYASNHDLEMIPAMILPVLSEGLCTIMICFYLPGIKLAASSLLCSIGKIFT